MNDFQVGHYYNFATYAPAILGQEHQRMRLVAIGDYQLASMFDNIAIKLNNIRAYLGDKAPLDMTQDTYLVFMNEAGNHQVFGKTWINLSTLESNTRQFITLIVEGASSQDGQRLKEILALAGYPRVTLQIKDISE